MNIAKRATVNLAQVFCVNFESPQDFSGLTPVRRNVTWPPLVGVNATDLMSARISRISLEILNLALAGEGAHLAARIPSYARRPVAGIIDARAIALVLTGCRPSLVDGEISDIALRVAADVEDWQRRVVQLFLPVGP